MTRTTRIEMYLAASHSPSLFLVICPKQASKQASKQARSVYIIYLFKQKEY